MEGVVSAIVVALLVTSQTTGQAHEGTSQQMSKHTSGQANEESHQHVGGVAHGIIFDSWKNFESPTLAPTPPVLTKEHLLGIYEQMLSTPAFWGLEITGADLAKEEVSHMTLQPVAVVVSDGGVFAGATRKLDAKLEKRKRHPIDLSLLARTGLGKLFPPATHSKQINRLLKKLPTLSDPNDRYYQPSHPYHGAHVAGIIGAENQDFGFSSVAQIEDLDVFLGESPARDESMVKAFHYLRERSDPTPILNMSHGLGGAEVENEIRGLVNEKDTVCVLASGNTYGLRIPNQSALARLKECIVVAALNTSGAKSWFSNFGNSVDLVAPGENILSRGRGLPFGDRELQIMSGTSMAAPAVSGTASMLRAILPTASAKSIRRILYATAIDLGLPGKDELTGYGLLNSLKAVAVAKRIAMSGAKTSSEIESLLKDAKLYDFSKEVEASRTLRELQNNLICGASEPSTYLNNEDRRILRRELLLDGSPQSLWALGELYMAQGFRDFGLGLKYAAINRPEDVESKESLAQMADEIYRIQTQRLSAEPFDFSIFSSLRNKELIFDVYTKLEPQTASLFRQEFKSLVANVDPKALDEFQTLIDQKVGKTLVIAQGDGPKKEP